MNQELESLGIVAKGKCLERIFDQLLVFLHEHNCDISLELIHLLYKNLLIAEMLNNSQFFVRDVSFEQIFSDRLELLELLPTVIYRQLSNLSGNHSVLVDQWNPERPFRRVLHQTVTLSKR